MATIHIRDVSDETVTTLKVRAARAGRSLQAYVQQMLEREAAALSTDEAADVARSIAARSSVTADDVTEVLDNIRAARG
ncbi:hypothetical protein [Jiangella sp. DSM 45060]|uniref:FitA-like ribbon-helix-helix domain-containing protein n=1 Tax=Jiangella sp. DSM 45060 TaxID=1798224 RepID=UPI00087A9634|nr:hypothetical protein [Jiangella sp. DSM 45060]SDS05993.1 hypothetical protein SAMN04515669_0240 [Jiangella sp. DSM 45060]